tara:strand:- start:1370 stop:1744 length:375 start_codon:yes stop_codon:yes gene_type:complete
MAVNAAIQQTTALTAGGVGAISFSVFAGDVIFTSFFAVAGALAILAYRFGRGDNIGLRQIIFPLFFGSFVGVILAMNLYEAVAKYSLVGDMNYRWVKALIAFSTSFGSERVAHLFLTYKLGGKK